MVQYYRGLRNPETIRLLLLVRFVWHIANVSQPHPRTRPHETLRIDRAISTFELEQSEELVWCSLTYACAQVLQAMVRGWSWRDERVRQANQATAEEQSSHGARLYSLGAMRL